jgi:hypothetical protein
MWPCSLRKESIQAALAAAEATTMVEAMKARETVLIAQANQGGLDGDVALALWARRRVCVRARSPDSRRAAGGRDRRDLDRISGLRDQAGAASSRSGWLGLGESVVVGDPVAGLVADDGGPGFAVV